MIKSYTWQGMLLPVLLCFQLSSVLSQAPVQTYFIPLPEDDLLTRVFKKNVRASKAPINSLTSIAIAADNTLIWFDHWEDGYEKEVTKPIKSTTEIWGDGDITNGCAPNIRGEPNACADPSDDILSAGDAIILKNEVPIPRRPERDIVFDGKDQVHSSFPVAMTRGAYPAIPGPFLAGAVEVLNTQEWGTEYVTPVGVDTVSETNAFEWSMLFIMAATDGTVVTIGKRNEVALNKGESVATRVREGHTISATAPVQVDLLASDRESFESRWYSLMPRSSWSNEYFTPVGTSNTASTAAWLYNPGRRSITVQYSFAGGETGSVIIGGGDAVKTPSIPNSSGALFTSDQDFYGITQTETNGRGENFDWGHPLIPSTKATSQVLVGWGYGCADNECVKEGTEFTVSRSVVFVAPREDAVINADFDSDGKVDEQIAAKALESIKIADKDNDMTGATIFATKTATSLEPVKIVASWGLDPDRSDARDSGALDLGTSVPPLPIIEAGKTFVLARDRDRNGFASPGDTIEFTIRVANVGQVAVPKDSWSVIDYSMPMFEHAKYVRNSASYCVVDRNGNIVYEQKIYDDSFRDGAETRFPLDESGVSNVLEMDERGGAHEIKFSVLVLPVTEREENMEIINRGALTIAGDSAALIDTFEAIVPFDVDPIKTLKVCDESGQTCGPILSNPEVDGTYCASQNGENLEITINIQDEECLLYETHLCNMPYLSEEALYSKTHTISVSSEEAYPFVCGFDEERYSVAGHATLICDDGTGEGEYQRNSYFEVELCCTHTFDYFLSTSAPYTTEGPGLTDRVDTTTKGPTVPTSAPTPAPTNAPTQAPTPCPYICPPNSIQTSNTRTCAKDFSDCGCKPGYKLEGDSCVADCSFVCPENSYPRADCTKTFRDCVCPRPFFKVGRECRMAA